MKIAAAAYPLDWFESWEAYVAKQEAWVAEAAGEGAELLLFPEYGAMELASLAGDAATDLDVATREVARRMGDAVAVAQRLAARHGVYIVAASGPVFDGEVLVNRAHLVAPSGAVEFQDKVIMTLWERDPWGVVGQGPLKVFDTALGKLAINICYDSEFPLLARAQREAELLLVPSCTEAEEGYWRVRIGSQARALEGQCVVAMASTVGAYPKVPAVEANTGMGGIFGPPDAGFPPNGVLAEGRLGQPGWTYAEVDLAQVAEVRANGHVRNLRDWDEQPADHISPEVIALR
ncbi:carbon-nitrogen hydrolase family protein [Pseudooceanicola sp. 502str34]